MVWDDDSERRKLLPPNWGSIGQAGSIVNDVFVRDGGRCRKFLPSGKRCPRMHPEFRMEVDHIGDREDHSLKNLRLLCEDHHKKVTQGQAWRAKNQKRRKFKRAEEEHPGR